MAEKGWINLTVLNAEEFAAQISGKRSQLQEALTTRVNALLNQLQGKLTIKIKQVMNRGYATGKLASSVNVQPAPVTTEGQTIEGSVGIPEGPTHKYAMAHEMGHAGAYKITATRARVLAFQLSTKANAKTIFARSVVHPPIPALRFVQQTQEENRQYVIDELMKTVAEVLARKP